MKFIKTMLKEKSGKINSNLSAPAIGNDLYYKPRRTMMALEPRIMFDGAAAETAADTVIDSTSAIPVQDTAVIDQDAAQLAEAAADVAPPAVQVDPVPQRTEILFIESNVADYQTLIDGAKLGTEVHVLDAGQDGLAQMAQILDGRSGIDAIHIVSHGSGGALLLGSVTLTAQNLGEHTAELTAIGNALNQNADILLYGCDVGKGSDGAAFVSALAQASQADVAASNDTTGAAALEGNWILETSSGYVDADIFFSAAGIESYHYTLATFDFQSASGDGTSIVTQTVSGITLTATLNDGATWWLGDAGNVRGTSGSIIVDQGDHTGETFTFSSAVDLASFRLANGSYAYDLIFTPIGGSGNSVVNVTTTTGGETIALGWTGITGFTVAQSGGGAWTDGWYDTFIFAPANAAPTLTAFASTVDTVNEDTEVEITLAELKAQGDEADADGTVDAFVIKAVSTGSLKIGTSAGTATAWAAGSNDTVDSTHQAYWTGAQDANGTLNAFTAVAEDNSGAESSTPRQVTVSVTAVNDAPTGLGNLTLAAVNEDTASPSGTAISALTGLSFADVDSGSSLGGVAVVGNTANSSTEGVWQYSTNAGTNWFAIGTVADNNTALALSATTLLRFVPVANYNGTPTSLTVRALDNTNASGYSTTSGTESRVTLNSSVNGTSTAISTNTNTIGTSITAVNDAPALTAGASLSYTENGSAAAIDATITVTDVDDTQIAGATVTISSGFTSGDTLGFTDQNGITGSYNSGTGVLTLSGTATKANYQTALRSVTYSSSSDTPTSSSSSRTVTWAVTDAASTGSNGAQTSTGVTSTVNLTAVNDAPALTAGASLSYTENGSAAAIDATITVTDVDDTQIAGATVTISSGFTSGDTLGFTDQNGITGSYNSGTGVLTLSGTATKANYQTALRSVTYSSSSDTPTSSSSSRTVTWAVTDAASTGSNGAQTSTGVTSTVNLTAVNDAPALTAGASLSYTENGSAAAIDAAITVTDVDDTQIAGATVTISSGFTSGDTLGFTEQNGITGSYNSGTGVLTLSGTATKANYQTALRSVTYSSSSDTPTSGSASRTVTWAVTDANAAAVGAQTSTGVTSTINVTAVNDAPTAIALSSTTSSTYDSGSNVTIGSLTRTDVDGGGPTYSIVSVNTNTSGAIYDLFNISGATLRAASPSTTTPGDYTVVVRVNDGDNNYDQSFTVTVTNTLVVDTATDEADDGGTYTAEKADGTGLSLREAIGIANRAGGGTISFASGLGTVTLGTSVTISENITLDADVVNSITVGGDISIASGKTLTVTNGAGDTLTLSGNISGAGSLTKSGVGTLVLSGSNSYSGNTTVSAGTLSIGGDSNLGSDAATVTLSGGNLTVTSAGTIDDNIVMSAGATITTANAVTLSGNITGNNALTKAGVGTLTLAGTNVLASSTVTGGILGVTDSTNLGSGGVTLNGGGLTVTGSGVTVSNAVALTGAGTITNDNAVALSGIVSGTGALTKAGWGTLTLSGDNTYSGATTVYSGMLVAAHNNALGSTAGSTTVSSGASLGLQGGVTVTEAVSVAGLGVSSAGAIYNVSGTNTLSGNVTLNSSSYLAAAAGQLTISGNINGGYSIIKVGAGTLVLSGTNAYDNTLILAGMLSVAADGNLGSGTVTLNGGDLTITGATTIDNAIALSQAATLTNADDVTLSGALSGSGALTKAGAGTLTLSNTGNSSAASALTVTSGVVSIATDSTLVGGAVTLNGGSLTVTGATTIDNAIALSQAATLTNANDVTLSGALSGSGALTKAGAGRLTLDNIGNSSASATLTVTAGTVSVASDSRLVGGAVTLNGGTLNLNSAGNIDNAIVLGASNGTINVTSAAGTLSGNITGTGSLTKTGGQLLTLSGTNDYSGGTTVRGTNGLSVTSGTNLGTGAVALEANLTITGTGTISNAIAVNADATIDNANAVTLSGVLSGSNALTKAGAGTLTLTAANTHTGAVTVSAGGLTLQGGSSIGDSSAVTVSGGATLTLAGGNETIGSLAGAGNVVLGYRLTLGGGNTDTTFSGVISGSGNGIVKTGTGTLTLTGNNTYTGSTTVSAGGLTLNSSGGALADTTAVSVASGATLTLSQDDTIGSISGAGAVVLNAGTLTVGGDGTSTTVSGVISGAGNLVKAGSGTLTLSGTNTYSGATTVSAGTLVATNSASLGSTGGGTTVSSGATLSIQGGITLAEALTLSGNGVSSAGALVNASGTNTLSGTVALAADSSIGTSAGTLTLSGVVSGSFALTKTGTGTLVLNATNTNSGTTTVSAGTLAGTGTVGGALTIDSGATLSPGVAGPGTLTVNGNLVIASGGILAANINGTTAGSDYDQVVVNGTVNVTGATLSTTLGFTPALNDSFRLIDNDSTDPITGTFSGLAEGAMTGILQASYAGGTNNDMTLALINNAPTGVGNLTLAAINEDAGSPAGTAISALTGYSFQDADSGATSPGILVVGNTANAATEGVWQYSSDGGVNWKAIGTVADGAAAALALASSTQVRFVPAANYNGTPPALSVRVLDNTYVAAFSTTTGGTETRVTADSSANGGTMAISGSLNTISTSITAVNDVPAFTKGADQNVSEDVGAQTVTGWVAGLSTGPADESGQTLSFVVSNNNNALFSEQPTIDSNGNLTYTPAANANGTATVTVSIKDNGGTANGGVDTSVTQTFTITVNPVNDSPTGEVTVSGTPTVGNALIAANTLADIDGLGAISYQWQANGIDIAGATGSSYVLTAAEVGKTVTVVARYTDGQGQVESAVSVATAQVEDLAPINLSQQTGNTDNSPAVNVGRLVASAYSSGSSGAGSPLGLGSSSFGGLSGSGLGGSFGFGSGGAGGLGGGLGGSSGGFGSDGTGSSYGSSSGSSQTMVMDMRLSVDSSGKGTSGGTINLPSSVFAGLNMSGTIIITATQASGQSLPSFISVNPSTGAVTVKEGAVVTNPITVKVTIKDSQGKDVVVLVKVKPQNGRTQQQNQHQGQDQQPDDGDGDNSQGQGRGQNQRSQAEQSDKQMAQASKPGLTQQLQRMGSRGFELQRQKLLDSLASITSNDKDAA